MKTRVDERIETFLQVQARFPSASAVVCILDISKNGCRIKTHDRSAKVGTTVVLELLNELYVSGEIVRDLETDCGVKFHRPVPEGVIDQIAAQPK